MKRMNRLAVVTSLAFAGLAGATAFAMPASASAQGTLNVAYNGACGAGYKVVDARDVETAGTTYLTWNDATGENCVVTIRTKPGAALYMQAKVFQTEHTTVSANDSGAFTTYAGPVYIPARGECVTWRAQIGDQYVLNQGHCG